MTKPTRSMTPSQAIAYLRGVIARGEWLTDDDNEMLDAVVERFDASAKPTTTHMTPDQLWEQFGRDVLRSVRDTLPALGMKIPASLPSEDKLR